MNSEKSTKSMVGEVLLDIITMGLLLAAFGTMFYNGFIIQSEGFTVGIMAAITFVGLIILFSIGTLSCLVTKVKKDSLTVGFLAFSAIQLFALVCNWSVLACLLINVFTVENRFMRIAYIVTTALLIVGYIVSILSYSGGMVDSGAGEESEAVDEADPNAGESESDDEDDDEEDYDEEDYDEDDDEDGDDDDDYSENVLGEESLTEE